MEGKAQVKTLINEMPSRILGTSIYDLTHRPLVNTMIVICNGVVLRRVRRQPKQNTLEFAVRKNRVTLGMGPKYLRRKNAVRINYRFLMKGKKGMEGRMAKAKKAVDKRGDSAVQKPITIDEESVTGQIMKAFGVKGPGVAFVGKQELEVSPEKKIEQKQNSIMLRIQKLQDTEARIRVANKAEADYAGLIVSDIAVLREEWKEEWYGTKAHPGSIPKADDVHKELVRRFKKLDVPMAGYENALKVATNDWLRREQAQLDADAARINAEEQEKHPQSTAVFIPQKIAIEGFTAKEVPQFEVYWCEGDKCKCQKMFGDVSKKAIHEAQGRVKLARAVGAGKVSVFVFEINNSFVRNETARLFDTAEEINGEKYVFPGVRVWKGSRLDRKGEILMNKP